MTGIIEVDGKEAESASLIFELVDLRLENRRLRAELIDNYAASCMDAGVILELRARVSEMEARYDSVTVALQEKCDELTAIKPAWSDAPEWATTWYIECGWAGGKHPNEEPYYMNTERRPEES